MITCSTEIYSTFLKSSAKYYNPRDASNLTLLEEKSI